MPQEFEVEVDQCLWEKTNLATRPTVSLRNIMAFKMLVAFHGPTVTILGSTPLINCTKAALHSTSLADFFAEEQGVFHRFNIVTPKAAETVIPWDVNPVVSLLIAHALHSQRMLAHKKPCQCFTMLRVSHENEIVTEDHCNFLCRFIFKWLTSLV
ncbi:hypothetical protein B0H17DRAFT_1217072 [Mycena rosella]|uniref:Uncharacterized protein n=1 Tax=Mycena rosella TaxID=1033263 RepID=A0AAD7C377_MYCRO|nr:hypothetical protein B0H17DRAFT_1217072 [Mycena rosella]